MQQGRHLRWAQRCRAQAQPSAACTPCILFPWQQTHTLSHTHTLVHTYIYAYTHTSSKMGLSVQSWLISMNSLSDFHSYAGDWRQGEQILRLWATAGGGGCQLWAWPGSGPGPGPQHWAPHIDRAEHATMHPFPRPSRQGALHLLRGRLGTAGGQHGLAAPCSAGHMKMNVKVYSVIPTCHLGRGTTHFHMASAWQSWVYSTGQLATCTWPAQIISSPGTGSPWLQPHVLPH